jgi:hypothetical protein
MEVAIVGLIAGLGYLASKTSVQNRRAKDAVVTVNRPETYPFAGLTNSEDLKKEQEKESETRWLASMNPRNSGIVDPRTYPFFSSMKTQNTNDDIKQRKMELFTGQQNDSVWKHKKESEPRFEPVPQNVSSSGSSGNAPTYDTMRKVSAVSGIQNSVLPFEQIQVGRGIGLDPKTSAGDGFHSMYRVMPVDASSYKRNTYEARPNHGVALNSAREVDPKFFSKGVPRFYTMDRRPLEKGRAAATGPANRAKIITPGCHVDTEEYFGIAGAPGQNVQGGAWDRDRSDKRPGLPLTNATADRHGIGGYTMAEYDDAKMVSQQRESDRTHGILTGNRVAQTTAQTFVHVPTNRALASRDQQGGAGHFVPAGTTQPSDLPQPTIREQLHDQSNGFAAAAPVIHGARVQCTDKQLLKESKRGSRVVNTYVNHAERTNDYRRAKLGDDLLLENRCVPMAVKSDTNVNRSMGHAQSSVMYMNQATPGDSSTANRFRLPEENRFQDYTIARDNVRSNDLHIAINR